MKNTGPHPMFAVLPAAQVPAHLLECYQWVQTKFGQSWSPYSNFRVACGLLLSDGQRLFGTNQENAAYPSGLCAERVALFGASNVLKPGLTINSLVVAAQWANGNPVDEISPCGGCRQVILEYEEKQKHPIEVLFPVGQQQFAIAQSAQALLPFCFDANSLNP